MTRSKQAAVAMKSPAPSNTSHFSYVWLLLLTGASRGITSLYLSPIYGSLNVENPSKWMLEVFTLLLFLMPWFFLAKTKESVLNKYMPLVISGLTPLLGSLQAIYVSRSVRWSSYLGPRYGPLIAQLLTCNILTSLVVLQPLFQESLSLPARRKKDGPRPNLSLFIACAGQALITIVQSLTKLAIERFPVASLPYGPLSLLLVTSLLFVTIIKKRSYLAIAVLSLVFTLPSTRTSWSISGVNGILDGVGFKILDRQHSITGYISILGNTEQGYQALRCDHSLLGGEWTRYPSHLKLKLREPIYAVFVTLEAVRLVEGHVPQQDKPASERQALMM